MGEGSPAALMTVATPAPSSFAIRLQEKPAFGMVLQEIRRKRGLSQEQLTFEAGVHRTHISQLEHGSL